MCALVFGIPPNAFRKQAPHEQPQGVGTASSIHRGLALVQNPSMHGARINVDLGHQAIFSPTEAKARMDTIERQEFIIKQAPRLAHRVCDELSIIQTATDLLIADESIARGARDKVHSIRDRIGYVAAFALQFLRLSDNLDSQRTVLDVRTTLSNLTFLLQRLLGDRNRLEMTLDPDLWPIVAAPEQIEWPIINLVVNAEEGMPRDGTLGIRAVNIPKVEYQAEPQTTSISADCVLIEVADTGVGIPKADLPRIFDPFFSTKGPNRGFGLATVDATIKKINGHIFVESEVAKGTTFRIFLPRHVPIAPAHTKSLKA